MRVNRSLWMTRPRLAASNVACVSALDAFYESAEKDGTAISGQMSGQAQNQG